MPSETVIDIFSPTPTNTNSETVQVVAELSNDNNNTNNNEKGFKDLGIQATMSSCEQEAGAPPHGSNEEFPPPSLPENNGILQPSGPPAPPPSQNGQRSTFNSNFGMPLVYRKDYPIQRFSRHWRRQEVRGLCCLALDLIVLTLWFGYTLKILGSTDKNGVYPLTFSNKVLLTMPDMYDQDSSCRRALHDAVLYENEFAEGGGDSDPAPSQFLMLPVKSRLNQVIQHKCELQEEVGPSKWFWNLLFAHILSIINVITASIFLCSLSARRRQGLQCFLLLPSFLSFFFNIFKQIPLVFRFGTDFMNEKLRMEMESMMKLYNNGMPDWDVTQSHMQCCGIHSPEDWKPRILNYIGGYPISCCNTTAFNCTGFSVIPPENSDHVWSIGCLPKEFEKVSHYDHYSVLFHVFKLLAEVGIFCTLSDLTRFEYPPSESIENSCCDIKHYHVKCRGSMSLRGVTKDGRVVVESKCFMPWRLQPSRTDLLTGLILYIRTSHNETKGSVQIDRRQNIENFVSEDIQVDLSRRHRGMFVFSLY